MTQPTVSKHWRKNLDC